MTLLPVSVASVRSGGSGFDMSDAVIMGASRGDVGRAPKAGDGAGEKGNGGIGGVVFTIRLDGADASVFYRKMRYVGEKENGNDATTY